MNLAKSAEVIAAPLVSHKFKGNRVLCLRNYPTLVMFPAQIGLFYRSGEIRSQGNFSVTAVNAPQFLKVCDI